MGRACGRDYLRSSFFLVFVHSIPSCRFSRRYTRSNRQARGTTSEVLDSNVQTYSASLERSQDLKTFSEYPRNVFRRSVLSGFLKLDGGGITQEETGNQKRMREAGINGARARTFKTVDKKHRNAKNVR